MNQRKNKTLSAGLCAMLTLTCTISGAGAQTETASENTPLMVGFHTPINAKLTAPQAISWSLPITGPLGAAPPVLLNPKQPKRLDASINTSDASNPIARQVEHLLESALDKDEKARQLDKAVFHYRKASQRAIAQTKDAVDYIVPYRGFGPSIEAANLITGEKITVKSRAAAEYARQKQVDETHIKVVSSVMQIAMGLGMQDQDKGAAVSTSGFDSLKALVGEEEAQHTMQMLAAWSKELTIPPGVYEQGAWDVHARQNKHKVVLEAALDNDEVLHQITKHLHKYGHKSKFTRISSQVIQTTLATAALTPSFIGPAAKTALLAYVMATGGPESCKLLKELYLDKRFESRWKVLNEESHLALENYQIAVLTRNPVLLACSESFISEMGGDQTVVNVFGGTVFGDQSKVASDPAQDSPGIVTTDTATKEDSTTLPATQTAQVGALQ